MKHTPLLAVTLLAGVLTACAQLENEYDRNEWSTQPSKAVSSTEGGDATDTHATSTSSDSDTGDTADAKTERGKGDLRYRVTKQAIPTGKTSTSALMLTKSLPEEVQKEQEFEYFLSVENLTKEPLDNVFIEERLPSSLRALGSEPAMMSNESGKLLWNVGSLAPSESREIAVRAMATADGISESFALASYDKALKGQVSVISPVLALTLSGPEIAGPGDTFPLEFNLSNTGTGTARGVIVSAALPEGLETKDGKREATMHVATLEAGKNRVLTLEARATQTGSFSPTGEASMKTGGAVSATAGAIKVEDTRLELTSKCPSKFFLGTPGKIEYTVKNVGQTLATNVTLTQPIPAGVELVRSSVPAEQTNGTGTWNLGDIPAGESKSVTVHLLSEEAGTLALDVNAKADKGQAASTDVKASMEGLPALHLGLEDLQDPVPVGESLTYHVKVHNQGTATAKDISVEISLDDGMQLVRAAGPTNGRAEGKKIVFTSLGELEPDATATWRLVIQSNKTGDLRLGVAMTSERLKRPVTVTESTQFYE